MIIYLSTVVQFDCLYMMQSLLQAGKDKVRLYVKERWITGRLMSIRTLVASNLLKPYMAFTEF